MAAQNLTFLQIVNVVLPRLRKATVAAVTTTTYSTMIGTLVNQVKTEIEHAWQWQALRDTYTVATVSGTSSYTLTDSGRLSQIFSVWNFTDKVQLDLGSRANFDQKFFGETVATGVPTLYLPNGFDSNYDMKIQLWPQPNSIKSLRVTGYFPQNDLTAAGNEVPLIPINPLIEGVVARALAERGDDGGDAAARQEAIYQNMLANAVAVEAGYDSTEVDFYPV